MTALSGKVAWITGGGSGIGEAGARALATAGATVLVSGRHQEELDRVDESIRSVGGKAERVACEVSDAQAVQRVADGILGHHGQVDILVASAGTNIGKRFWKDVTPAGWDEVVIVATPLLKKRPLAPPPEEMDRMLQPEDLGATMRFVAELPPRVCVNEILIGPTWNRVFLAGRISQRAPGR